MGALKIKPCKNCGGEGVLQEMLFVSTTGTNGTEYSVKCSKCKMQTETQRTKTLAIKSWNGV